MSLGSPVVQHKKDTLSCEGRCDYPPPPATHGLALCCSATKPSCCSRVARRWVAGRRSWWGAILRRGSGDSPIWSVYVPRAASRESSLVLTLPSLQFLHDTICCSARMESQNHTVAVVADQLRESEPGPLSIIQRAIATLGSQTVLEYARRACEIHEKDGMLTLNKQRKRTLGGVFFRLLREEVKEDQRLIVFPLKVQERVPFQALSWEEGRMLLDKLQGKPHGQVETVHIKLIGRPDHFVSHGDSVLAELQGPAVPSDLPREVPTPPAPSRFAVYIAAKHWEQVEARLKKHPDDQMVVEGIGSYDPGFPGITVSAFFATTKQLQAEQRAQQAAKKEAGPNASGKSGNQPEKKKRKRPHERPAGQKARGMRKPPEIVYSSLSAPSRSAPATKANGQQPAADAAIPPHG
jgi:hypothetical protein